MLSEIIVASPTDNALTKGENDSAATIDKIQEFQLTGRVIGMTGNIDGQSDVEDPNARISDSLIQSWNKIN